MIRDPQGIERAALNGIDPLHGVQMLEVGCGDGRLTQQFAKMAAHVTAIDMDATIVSTAPKRRNTRYMAASAIDLPFPAQTFDTALLAWSL